MNDYDNREIVECTCAMTESSYRSCAAHGENAPPNMVEVDADGCSCPGFCRACKRSDIDVACPIHAKPLRHGDGDVLVAHPNGTYSIIREPVTP